MELNRYVPPEPKDPPVCTLSLTQSELATVIGALLGATPATVRRVLDRRLDLDDEEVVHVVNPPVFGGLILQTASEMSIL